MARNLADEKWVYPISTANEIEEDEEALSLSDLPINGHNQSRTEEPQSIRSGEDFDFGGSVFTEPEMCSADELFFQGQILPLRHSVSSDSALVVFPIHGRNPSRFISRSKSGGFTSVSSRSSSIRSQNSSSSGSSTAAATSIATAAATYNQKVRNRLYSEPSPTPQLRRLSSARYGNASHRSRKSTTWSFFRVGLVQTPVIELKDLRVRSNSTGRSSTSSGVLYNSKSNRIGDGDDREKNGAKMEKKKKKKKEQRLIDKNGALFGGCKCSVDAVETIPLNEAQEDQKQQATKKKKQAMARRHRTFEWLKELSLAGVPDPDRA